MLYPALRDAIKDDALTSTSFRALLLLVETLDFGGAEGKAVKHDWIAKELNLRTTKPVRRALSQLAKRGYVDRTPGRPGVARLYVLNYQRKVAG